ncbi:MAG: hypothetical protein PHC51_14535, partial [bacterium]|nr:hypothetical protein [bacterium]
MKLGNNPERCFLRYWLFASMLLPLCLTFALTVVPRPLLAQTQIPEKFRVRLELNLCPEYRIKPMSLKFVYRVGEETEIRNPDVIST